MNPATRIKTVKLAVAGFMHRTSEDPLVKMALGPERFLIEYLVEIIFIVAFILVVSFPPYLAAVWSLWWDHEVPIINIYRGFRHGTVIEV